MDQQSKVFDTGTKKPGGKDFAMLPKQRAERLQQDRNDKLSKGRKRIGDEKINKDATGDALGQRLPPAVREARASFYDKEGPTVDQVIDKVKKISRLKKKKKKRIEFSKA